MQAAAHMVQVGPSTLHTHTPRQALHAPTSYWLLRLCPQPRARHHALHQGFELREAPLCLQQSPGLGLDLHDQSLQALQIRQAGRDTQKLGMTLAVS